MKAWWVELRERRWAAGRAKYGDTWAGGPPLAELFEELADASNYIEAAVAQGDLDQQTAGYLSSLIHAAAMAVRPHLTTKENRP